METNKLSFKSAEDFTPQVEEIFSAVISEVMGVLLLKNKPWTRPAIETVFRTPVHRMAEKFVRLDQNVAEVGWSRAAGIFLNNFVADYRVSGVEQVPRSGPLLVISNHPGTYDTPIISTVLGRDDLKIIASDISIFRRLPHVNEHFISISRDVHKAMLTVRTALRHLQQGGSLLIFPRGEVEPDQDVTPGALPDFERWSSSSELFLRKVPQTQVVPVFAKGVLSPQWIRNPLVRIWKTPARRQKVAEIFQVAQQLIGNQKISLIPTLQFSRPLSIDDLGTAAAPEGELLKAMIRQVQALIEDANEQKTS